jgi:Leucine-rich repeat (LRR) protein
MRNSRLCWICFCFLMILSFGSVAQKSKKPAKKPPQKTSTQKSTTKKPTDTKKAPEAKKPAETRPAQSVTTAGAPDEQKVKDIISFLQYVLNTLGDPSTSSRDKDVLITESFTKIFRDAKVQVEDDLDDQRKVITNKDVVAYLKDVDFFFEEVKFEFLVDDIKSNSLPNGNLFYKVTLRRNMTGTTSDGEKINNTQPRFVEINYNPDDQDLKIVSMYTNLFDEKEALTNWWNELSYEWQSVFRKKINLNDSATLEHIKTITAIEELDLSNNTYITTIDPLGQLINLKMLNLSGTAITDLTPIRNLTELVELDLENTKVFDLSPLRYSLKLARLNIKRTSVNDISPLEKMSLMQNLQMSKTPVFEFKTLSNFSLLQFADLSETQITHLLPFESLTHLSELNISKTLVQSLTPLQKLKSLSILNIDSTRIRDLQPLSTLDSLSVLHANHTQLDNLQPLQKLPLLEKVYCDQTLITREKADAFTTANRNVLVIFDSKDLSSWWSSLGSDWQRVLSKAANVNLQPSKEELARVTTLDSINISNQGGIKDLEPLRKLPRLKFLNASNTSISDITALENHRDLAKLDISATAVSDLFITRQFSKLKELRADRSKVENVDALSSLPSLELLYVDQTTVHDIIAQEFLAKNPKCLIVYKTVHLNRWWSGLTSDWKNVFRSLMGKDTASTRENLHRLTELETVEFRDAGVTNLDAFNEFVRLKTLKFSGTAISSIPPLDNLRTLTVLHATNSPLQHIGAVGLLKNLTELDISNTPVDELKPVSVLENLKVLNAAGTQIKKIDPVENLHTLESLDCSNTRVSNLEPASGKNLKILRCYNTKVSSREADKFKENNPNCQVVYYR